MTDVIAGRFALCDPIARGGTGVVWRAFDRRTGRLCAAKVLRRRDAGDLLRFVREQSVRVNGPHVLTPYSWAAEDAHVVIASELVDGGSLSTLMGDYGPLDESTVAVILDQLLDGLDNVHAAGLVHRDVKPANVLLRASGTGPIQALLSDFGLAVGAEDARLTQVGMVIGTPGYLPPELMHSSAAPSPVHDLYAAGKVAAALLNGVEPAQYVAPPDLTRLRPGPLRDLLVALTAPDPRHRPQTARQARAWLRHSRMDTVPRTRDGEAIEVLHQLPPLDPAALQLTLPTMSGAATTQSRGDTPPGTPAGSPLRAPQTAHLPALSQPPQHAARRGLRSRRVLLISGATVAIVAGGVPLAVILTSSDGTGPSPTQSHSPSAGVRVVQAGVECGWQNQGDHAATPDGKRATCILNGARFVWANSS